MIAFERTKSAAVFAGFVCPLCSSADLKPAGGGVNCCGCDFQIRLANDGIVDAIGSHPSLTIQERHYDEGVDIEWETWRPSGAPELHRWILEQKLRLPLELSRHSLRGTRVVNVCSGSGMDAEFLFDRGADVVLVDLSIAALRRAQTRLSVRGHSAGFVRAYAEHLPYSDRSFDIAFVHDGLHHLDRPELAVRELARVARQGVFVLEPASSALTSIAVHLGLSLRVEEAGNAVRRFHSHEVARWLREGGMTETASSRALIRQTHCPTRTQRWLSAAPLQPVARLIYRLVAVFPGRWVGNKLTVVGSRGE